MLIVVEGPDGSGKSSFCEALVKRLSVGGDKVDLLHRGPPTQHPLEEYARPLYGYRPDRGQHLVIDRWHVGELVYPRILNRPTQLDEPTLRHIELLLMSRGAVIVHLTQNAWELQHRVQARGDDLIKPAQLESIRMLFNDVFRTVVSTSTWTLNGVPTAHDVEAIIHSARGAEIYAADLNPFTTYIGNERANVLLFGDVRGSRNEDPLAPAFVPCAATSGYYLLRSLGMVQATSKVRKYPQRDWRMIGIANACDVDDPRALWNVLGKPLRTVALGVNADRRLTELGVPHETAPHPQFVRRFHYGDGLEYGRYLVGQTEELPWR